MWCLIVNSSLFLVSMNHLKLISRKFTEIVPKLIEELPLESQILSDSNVYFRHSQYEEANIIPPIANWATFCRIFLTHFIQPMNKSNWSQSSFFQIRLSNMSFVVFATKPRHIAMSTSLAVILCTESII